MPALPRASATLRERLLAKIVNAGPAAPCATWVGAYNVDGRKSGRKTRGQRPVIYLDGGDRGPIVYVAPLLLALAHDTALRPLDPETGQPLEALHRCTPSWDGVYRCVDLACLRWGTRLENEADKRREDDDDGRA